MTKAKRTNPKAGTAECAPIEQLPPNMWTKLPDVTPAPRSTLPTPSGAALLLCGAAGLVFGGRVGVGLLAALVGYQVWSDRPSAR